MAHLEAISKNIVDIHNLRIDIHNQCENSRFLLIKWIIKRKIRSTLHCSLIQSNSAAYHYK